MSMSHRRRRASCTRARRYSLALFCGAVVIPACTDGPAEPPITILPAEPASLDIAPDSLIILESGDVQLLPTVLDSAGNTLASGTVTWASFDPSIASVDSVGHVRGVRLGQTLIRAAVGDLADTALVLVRIRFASIATGVDHTCGVSTIGNGYCWGAGGVGRLGNGETRSSTSPQFVSGGLTFQILAASFEYSCGLTSEGDAHCWGGNRSGQLGSGTKYDTRAPIAVAGDLTFVALSASPLHACGLTFDGAAHCWGGNWFGEVGSGHRGSSSAPTPVAGARQFTSVSTGAFFTCGATRTGVTYCWGANESGQLGTRGNGDSCRTPYGEEVACSRTPRQLQDAPPFVQVTGGSRHGCGLTQDGVVSCWGDNAFGQLGNGTTAGSTTPVPVRGDLRFGLLTAGDAHTCGIALDGAAYCWGRNSSGELGTSATFDNCGGQLCATSPVPVGGGFSYAGLSGGGSSDGGHTCGVTPDGTAFCWGRNATGQLGSGAAGGNSFVPVRVSGQP